MTNSNQLSYNLDAHITDFLPLNSERGKDGYNWYAYVGNDPINFIDPNGLETTVYYFENSEAPWNGIGGGSHTSVSISNPKGEDPVLFDPNGSYRASESPSGFHFMEGDVTEEDYINYHLEMGDTVTTYTFDTTPKQEREIFEQIITTTTPSFMGCTAATTNAIKGVEPFEDLDISIRPGSLKKDLDKIAKKVDVEITKTEPDNNSGCPDENN